MKQKIIYICALFASFAFFSCSQDGEIFSCDKDVNAWVKENLAEIRQMDRAEWLKLDEVVKGPAFAAFTPNQKKSFWEAKLQKVMLLDWNEKELEHLNLLYKTVQTNPDWFNLILPSEKDDAVVESLEVFMFKWIEYAKECLEWDRNLIGAIVASGNDLINKNGLLASNSSSSIRLKDGSELSNRTCDCSLDSDWCNKILFTCKDDGCWIVPYCGTFLLYRCDGYCK